MLFEHVLEIFICGDGNEGIEVFVRELVLERKRAVTVKRAGEMVGECGYGGGGGATVNGDDAGLSAGVAERFCLWSGDYVAAVAAHKADFGCG